MYKNSLQAINDQIYKTIHMRKKELWKFKLLVLNSVDVALKTKQKIWE